MWLTKIKEWYKYKLYLSEPILLDFTSKKVARRKIVPLPGKEERKTSPIMDFFKAFIILMQIP